MFTLVVMVGEQDSWGKEGLDDIKSIKLLLKTINTCILKASDIPYHLDV